MSGDLHWSLVVTKNAHLDGEGKVTIERTSIQRLVKQAFDAGAEQAVRERIESESLKTSPAVEQLKQMLWNEITLTQIAVLSGR